MDRFDLGAHARTVSTPSPEAQRWFNLGLNWCFGFNKEEGVKCFLKALEHDPEFGCLTAPRRGLRTVGRSIGGMHFVG
jgi:hypothetical protein